MLFYWLKLLYPTIVFYYFSLSLLSVYRLVLWGWGLHPDGCISLALSLAPPTYFINNNNSIFIFVLTIRQNIISCIILYAI